MALVGTVAVRLNNRPAVTITEFNETVDRPGQIKAGGYGVIDASQGVETGSGSFKLAPRQENGLEFPIDVLRQIFSMNYPLGNQRFVLLGCQMTQMTLTNQQKEGNTEYAVSFIYQQKKQTQ